MNELLRLIEHCQIAIARLERHIPTATGAWRDRLVFHRDWELSILAEYQRHIANA